MERITSQMILEEGNDQRDGTQIQQTIVHPAAMISNQRTHQSHAPIERASTTRKQQLIIVWEESQLIATSSLLTNDGVGR